MFPATSFDPNPNTGLRVAGHGLLEFLGYDEASTKDEASNRLKYYLLDVSSATVLDYCLPASEMLVNEEFIDGNLISDLDLSPDNMFASWTVASWEDSSEVQTLS